MANTSSKLDNLITLLDFKVYNSFRLNIEVPPVTVKSSVDSLALVIRYLVKRKHVKRDAVSDCLVDDDHNHFELIVKVFYFFLSIITS